MSFFTFFENGERYKLVDATFYGAFVLIIILGSVYLGFRIRLQEFVSLLNKIPGPNYHPFLNIIVAIIPLLKNKRVGPNVLFTQSLCGYTLLYGHDKGIWRFWSLYRPLVVLSKAESVEVLLNNSFHLDKSGEYYYMRAWLKAGLITSPGSKWKVRRKILTPAFHFRILQNFLPVFEEQSRVLVDKLHSLKGSVVDIVPLMTLCALDIICETAMGISIGAQANTNSPYVEGLHRVRETFTTRLTYPWYWFDFIFYRTQHGKQFTRDVQNMSNFVQQVIRERKEEMLQSNKEDLIEEFETQKDGYCGNGKKKKAFLDLLLYNYIVDNSLSLSDIEEEVHTFMFAGHDTTATGISWALYKLGCYPEVQEKVHDELYSVFKNDTSRPITEEDLKKLKYMECVLKETLRLYPTVPLMGRKLKDDTMINGYLVPKKSSVLVLIYMLHRQPDIFPNPEFFDPDRFLPENVAGRHPFAYLPFSAGPRNCIGQKFALMEEKVVLTNILRQFRVTSLDDLDNVHVVMEVTLKSMNGLRLKFTPKY